MKPLLKLLGTLAAALLLFLAGGACLAWGLSYEAASDFWWVFGFFPTAVGALLIGLAVWIFIFSFASRLPDVTLD